MSEAAAALHGVAQRFGRKVVLRELELELRPGSIVGLVGANGSGKTTLFAVLAGLLQPDTGERRLFGRPADEVDAEARGRLAYVAHATQLYGALSARENLRLFADLRAAAGLSTRPADEVLLELGLSTQALGRPVATFSRGMAQRVALARALAARPELLLLDEPFTALDAAGRGMLSRVLLGERSRGAAVLLSSHDFDALVQICDRIVLLEDGALVRSVEHHEHGKHDLHAVREDFRRRAAALWHDLPADPGDTLVDGPS